MVMKRKHIPILTKCLVVRRQLRETYGVEMRRRPHQTLTSYFEELISALKSCMNCGTLQLDHNPALGLRKFSPETGEYKPRETDHRYLEYRRAEPGQNEHLQKTTGRKADAERTVTTKGSDVWLMKKFRRLEGEPRHKAKIPSRPFPKTSRKFGA